MATVTSVVLVILTVRCAIVLSQQQPTQRNDETSLCDAAEQMAIVAERQGRLLEKLEEEEADVKQLQADVKGLRAEFACHFSTCESCTSTHVYRHISYMYL